MASEQRASGELSGIQLMPARRVALESAGWFAIEAVWGLAAEAKLDWHFGLFSSTSLFFYGAVCGLLFGRKTPRRNLLALAAPPPASVVEPRMSTAIRTLVPTLPVIPALIVGLFARPLGSGVAGVAVGTCLAWLSTWVVYVYRERKHAYRLWLRVPQRRLRRSPGRRAVYRTENGDRAPRTP